MRLALAHVVLVVALLGGLWLAGGRADGGAAAPLAAADRTPAVGATPAAPSATVGGGAVPSAPAAQTDDSPSRAPAPDAGGRTLTLHFVDERGEPIEDACVTLVANTLDLSDTEARRLATDRAVGGRLVVPLPDDVALVVVRGYAAGRQVLAQGIATPPEADSERTLTWPAGGALRLRAVDADGVPRGGVRVNIEALGDDSGDLRYSPGMAPGELWFWTATGGAWRVTLTVRGFGSAEFDVALAVGDARDGGDVALTPGPTFTGRVVLADGTPVDGVSVLAVDPGTRYAFTDHGRAVTDVDGRFHLATDRAGPLEVRVGREDPAGTAFALPEPEQFELELVSEAAFFVLDAGADGRFDSWLAVAGDSDVPFQDWVGRWHPVQINGPAGDDGGARVLLDPSFPWRFSASIADGAAADGVAAEGAVANGAPEFFAEVDAPRRSRRVDVFLARRTDVADASIAVTAHVADGLGDLRVTAVIACDERALRRSAPIESGARVVFDGLPTGDYVASVRVRLSLAGGDPPFVVAPHERALELGPGGDRDAAFDIVQGAFLEVDLSALPYAALDEALARGRWAFVALERDGGEPLHPADAGPHLVPLGPDGELLSTGAGQVAFGHRHRTPSPLPPGNYRVVVRARGYEPWSQAVELRPAETATVVPRPTAEGDG